MKQAGRANARAWMLEFEPREPQRLDPLLGWSGSGDVYGQVRLAFPDRASAERFARRRGLDYKVVKAPHHG